MIASKQSLGDLLQATSRSFYLTLRVLPACVRPQIGLAYLLARTTDTIADTEILPLDQRLAALQALRERILGLNSTPLNFGEFAKQQSSAAETLLLERVEDSLSALQSFSAADQQLIRDVLTTITSGQELDLRRFAQASIQQIVALETDIELDDYTYRVAGCVGEFWTKICRKHCCRLAIRHNFCRCITATSTRRNRICSPAGITRTRCLSRNFAFVLP